MTIQKSLLARLAHGANFRERPHPSRFEQVLDDAIAVLVVFVWLGAMVLLP
jgi:hypothetical protein